MARDRSDQDEWFLRTLAEVGRVVTNVFESDSCPGFCYTTGLHSSCGHPELIVFGLEPELMKVMLNNVGHDVSKGATYDHGKAYDGVLEDFECWFFEVPRAAYPAYLG